MFKKIKLKTTLWLAFFVRLFLSPWNIHSDVNATYWWGKFAAEFGFRGYYDWLYFGGHGKPDQPMINIYYDWLVRLLYQFIYKILWFFNVHIPAFPSKFMQWYFDYGNQILLKLPMIIADILLIYFGYKFIEKNLNVHRAKIFSLILAFYPPFIFNSAVWGSGDSIVNLLALLAIYKFWHKGYLFGTIFFLLSVLYKPSLLIWTPILLIIFIKNRPNYKQILTILLTGIFSIFLISYPFTPYQIGIPFNPVFWFVRTMSIKILPGIMDQMTANALNFWALIYTLKPKLDNFYVLNLIKIRPLSILICLSLYLYDYYHLFKNYSLKRLLLTLVNVTMITFIFMTRMHERYTFPALIPLLALSLYDKNYWKYFIVLSVSHFYNVFCSWVFPKVLNFYPLIFVFSLTNIYLTLKLLYTKGSWK